MTKSKIKNWSTKFQKKIKKLQNRISKVSKHKIRLTIPRALLEDNQVKAKKYEKWGIKSALTTHRNILFTSGQMKKHKSL